MDQSLSVTPYPCGSSRHEIEAIGCNEDILKEKEDHHEQHHQRNKNNEYSSFSPSPSCDVVKRTYYVYVPCSATSMVTNSSPLPLEVGYLPLVYALHGYTGDASSMKKWENIAQKFNFILVRPEGVNRSWNARYCCGYALENDINDQMFLQRLLDEIVNRSKHVKKDMVYGLGWSNGAYMVTLMARMFRSVVPIAGYQYEDILLNTRGKSRGIFQHHSLNDPVVRYGGCCTVISTGSTPSDIKINSTAAYDTNDNWIKKSCCCGISLLAKQCISVDVTFKQWAKQVNQCESMTTVFKDNKRGIECRSGTGCSANSTLCVYENGSHFGNPSFSRKFPMFDEVGHFFARDACSMNGGRWENEKSSCSCDLHIDGSGVSVYCAGIEFKSDLELGLVSNNSKSFLVEALDSGSDEWFVPLAFLVSMIVILFVAVIAVVAAGAIRKNRRLRMFIYDNNYKWERLSAAEPTEVELTSTSRSE